MVRSLPLPALLLDATSAPLDASGAFLDLVGIDRTELAGLRSHAGWWSDEPGLTGLVAKVCDLQRAANLDGRVSTAGGAPMSARIEATPLLAEDGRTVVLCLVGDRSAEVRLSDRLRATIDSGLDALMVFTVLGEEGAVPTDAVLADASPRAAELLGLRLGGALGRPLSRLADPDSALALREMFAEARADGPLETTRRLRLGPGRRPAWLKLQVTPLGDDELIVMARDVTRERTLRDALHASLEHARGAAAITRLVRDEDGNAGDVVLVEVDHAAATELGLVRDQAEGTSLSRVLGTDEMARVVAHHEDVLLRGEPRDVTGYPLGLGPSPGTWRLTPLPDDAVLAVRLSDDSDLSAEDAADLLNAGFENAVLARAVRDPEGRVVDAVIEVASVTRGGPRVPTTALQGARMSVLVAEAGFRALMDDVEEALRTGAVVDRVRRVALAGEGEESARPVEMRTVPMRDDRFAGSWRDADGERSAVLRIRQALEGSLDGFQIIQMIRDPDGRIVDGAVVEANERIAEQMGTTRARYLGTRMTSVAAGGSVDRVLAEYEHVLHEGRPIEHERPFTLPGQTTRWIRYQMLPLDDAVAVLSRDVTEARRAEEEMRRLAEQLSFVARHASETISLHAPDGRFQFVSDASRRVWSRTPGELLGHNGLDFIHHGDRERVAECMARIRTGDAGDQVVTMRVMRPDGGTSDLDLSIRAIRDAGGGLEAFLWVSSDAGPRLDAERRAAERVEESARRAAEQGALRRVATAAAGTGSVESVLDIAAREVALLLEADVGLVVRFEDEEDAVVVGTSRPDLPPALHARFPIGQVDALADVVRFGRGARSDRPSPAPTIAAPALTHASAVAAPVRVEGRLWGGIIAATLDDHPLPGGVEVRLGRFAEIIELALAAADARRRLADQAVTDALTGLANHRAFHERLREELARAQRHGRPMALAIMDIDHFKRLNDVYGHQVGDQVLAEVARRMRETARVGEVVARIGGEEFGWILPETDADGALDAVERARQAVACAPAWGDVTVTVSAGVADTGDADDAGELFRVADGALYWAKADGRDTARRYSSEGTRAMSAEDRAARLERGQTLVALRSLARAVDAKDQATHEHSERVAALAGELAVALGWDPDDTGPLRDAALLHDVGKIGVPDAVLLREGPLAPADRALVQRHAALGAEIASDALSPDQCAWIRHHHEHWDGRGYPDGLAGEAIPEAARIIAVADAWDAMTMARHHEPPMSRAAAMEEMERCAGTQFWTPAVQALARLVGLER